MSARALASRADKVGLPPGSVVFVGEPTDAKAVISVVAYDENTFEEARVDSIEQAFAFRGKAQNVWINVDGIHDVELIRKVGEEFGLHPLTLEDIANPGQRPKREDYGEFIYVVLKALSIVDEDTPFESEQISIIFGKHYVLSFQEKIGDAFEPVHQRFRTGGQGRLRKLGPDYLTYALIDTIVDHYFVILESVGERIEVLEDELVSDPTSATLHRLHTMKRAGLFLRRAIWPLREVVAGLEREESPLINHATTLFLRDVYDHVVQVIDSVETYREMLGGMLDIYLSSVSNRLNVVMKVLTIFSSIFLPLTFIAGIYGMNFEHMPELKWEYGYPIVLAGMALVALAMILFFKRRKWI